MKFLGDKPFTHPFSHLFIPLTNPARACGGWSPGLRAQDPPSTRQAPSGAHSQAKKANLLARLLERLGHIRGGVERKGPFLHFLSCFTSASNEGPCSQGRWQCGQFAASLTNTRIVTHSRDIPDEHSLRPPPPANTICVGSSTSGIVALLVNMDPFATETEQWTGPLKMSGSPLPCPQLRYVTAAQKNRK